MGDLLGVVFVRRDRLPVLAAGTATLVYLLASSRLVVDGRELGPGYGHPTPQSSRAIAALNGGPRLVDARDTEPRLVGDHTRDKRPRLDGVYSGKAAAALLRLHRDGIAPLLFWATKATTVLPPPSLDALRATDRELARWMRG